MIKLFKLFLPLILFTICASHSQSQKRYVKDSLDVLKNHDLFEAYLHKDILLSKAYLDTLRSISNNSNYTKATYYYYLDAGNYYFVTHNLKTSEAYYQKAFSVAKAQGLKKEAINANLWLGNFKYFQEDKDAAKAIFSKTLKSSIQLDYIDGIANAYSGLSTLETHHEEVLKWQIKIDSLYNKRGGESAILSNAYDIIGRIYLNNYNNKEVARTYFNKALEISRKVDYTSGINYLLEVLYEMDIEEGNYNDAYTYLEEKLRQNTIQKDTINIAHSLTKLAQIDIETNKLNQAEEKLLEAKDYFKTLKDSLSQINVNLMLTNLHLKDKNILKAEHFLNEINPLTVKLENYNYKARYYETSVELLEQKKNYKQALLKQRELDSIRTLRIESKNNKTFLELERQFNSQKKEQEIELLTAKNKLVEEQKTNQRNLLLAVLGIVILIGLFFYYQNKSKQKVTKKLKELDNAKNKFIANITHELRTPLTLISGPVQKLTSSSNINKDAKQELQQVKDNSERLLKLVDQLLEVSKIESGVSMLTVFKKPLIPLIAALSQSFEAVAKDNEIDYSYKITPNEDAVYFDSDKIEKIVLNLLSNAIKYTSKNHPKIEVSSKIEQGQFNFRVSNTVDNTDALNTHKFFERFYQDDDHREGVGLGLALVKELVELHKGAIEVVKDKQDITFQIRIPVEQKAYTNEEITTDVIRHQDFEKIQNDIDNKSEQPIILIIDDSEEIRHFVTSLFKDTFQILEASNGTSGLAIATEQVPDIIISDIMMPNLDGKQLTHQLKTDERTSHIPILLLTAKVDDESKISTAKLGADAYVTKPFNIELLKAKVNQLLDNRKLLQQRYSQEVVLKPKDLAISSTDEIFLEKIQEILEAEITNPDFNTEKFGEAVGMSRMQLYRKLKALTGLTATEFIRSQRLKLAASLLKQSDVNVAEIGYAVGFNDPSYFSKCFKEAYGCTPKQYAQKSKGL